MTYPVYTAPPVAPTATPATATATPDSPLSEVEVNYVIQIAAANGMRLQPHQVPAFVKLYGIYEKSYKQ